MATKKRSKDVKKRKRNIVRQQIDLNIDAAMASKIDRLFVISGRLFFALYAVYSLWKLDVAFNWSGFHTIRFGVTDKIYFWGHTFLSLIAMAIITSIRFKPIKSLPEDKAVKILKALIILYSLMLAWFLAALLQWLGFIGIVSKYISLIWPGLSKKIASVLSLLFGWALSGVVGNLVYDLLKRKALAIINSKP